jgi:predicted aconitase
MAEFEVLRTRLRGRHVHPGVVVHVATARETYARITQQGWADELASQGVEIITDTCTYLRPMLDFGGGTVLTSSAKWAWYAPMTVGTDVVLGSLAECVESAVSGRLEIDDGF